MRISVDGPVLTPKITGIFTTDDGNVTAGGSLALFDTATAQKLFGKAGTYDEIDVKAAAGTSQTALKAQLDSALPKGLTETTTAQKLADDQAETIASSMSGLKQGLLVFAGIALFVGTFIIANTFTMLVAQRTKELARCCAPSAPPAGRSRGRCSLRRSWSARSPRWPVWSPVSASAPGCAPPDGHDRRDRPGRPAGHHLEHGPERPRGRHPHHDARRLAARPSRREDPAGRRDEQSVRDGHHQVARPAQHARRAVLRRGHRGRHRGHLDERLGRPGTHGPRRRPPHHRRLHPDPAAVPPADRGLGAGPADLRDLRQAGPPELGAQPAPYGPPPRPR